MCQKRDFFNWKRCNIDSFPPWLTWRCWSGKGTTSFSPESLSEQHDRRLTLLPCSQKSFASPRSRAVFHYHESKFVKALILNPESPECVSALAADSLRHLQDPRPGSPSQHHRWLPEKQPQNTLWHGIMQSIVTLSPQKQSALKQYLLLTAKKDCESGQLILHFM